MIDLTQFRAGAIADPRDERDFFKAAAPKPLPPAASVRFRPAIKNQRTDGACTGFAAAWMWEQILVSRGMKWMPFSPLFLYYYARAELGRTDEDSGATIRSVMSALHKMGVPLMERWPNTMSVYREPDEIARQVAAALVLHRYERCGNTRDIKYSIAIEDQAVVVGLPIYADWATGETARTGRVHYRPHPRRDGLGGHALAICGYDDTAGHWIFANSWGADYGDEGYNYVPYEFFDKEPWDAWTAGWDALPDRRS